MKKLLLKMLGIGAVIWEFLAPIIKDAAANTLTELLPVALDVVLSLANHDTSGAEKRELAVKRVKTLAITQGIATTESVVRLAIELAVARMKEGRETL